MGRWTQYDEDSTRLPEGMTRIGYDADTQQYTFQAADGQSWTSAPGNEYGKLTRVSSSNTRPMYEDDIRATPVSESNGRQWRFDQLAAEQQALEEQTKSSWKMLAPFLLLVCLVPLLAYHFLWSTSGTPKDHVMSDRCEALHAAAVIVREGDICWDIARNHDMTLEELASLNPGLRCDDLRIGNVVCVKKALSTDQD